LKDQLRQQQKKLIRMKEEKRLKKHEKMLKSKARKSMTAGEMNKFVKYIKEFQLNQDKRDMPPVLRKIVKNLTCQEHKFMYCPSCKNFDDVDFNPMENIQQFLKFVDQEQKKWKEHKAKEDKKRSRSRSKSPEKNAKKQFNMPQKGLAEDSISEITELDKKEILTKYYEEVMTYHEKKKKERD